LALLAGVDPAGEVLTAPRAAALNAALRQLREQGAVAVPAIEKFLESDREINFDSLVGGNQVDYGSLRLALIDGLGQIGGPAATAATVRLLGNTVDPLEIALLTRELEQLAPQQYRAAELAAAQDVLQQTLTGNWGANSSALFETLQAVGDARVVPVLKDAVKQWNYYATLALAGLPDGAGIPALIDLVQDPSIRDLGKGDYALRPLAQVAVQYPAAAATLVDQARLNQIPDSAWPTVIAALTGHYISFGNQIFGETVSGPVWSEEEIRQRLRVLTDLLTVTANVEARQSLQSAAAALTARLPHYVSRNG